MTDGTAPAATGVIEGTPRREHLRRALRATRDATTDLCKPLEPEDFVVQSMPDASPPKWHLGHTTWFFETFILLPSAPGYGPYHPDYSFLFNSYYNAIGDRLARPERGLLTRPPIADIFAYRAHVDAHLRDWLDSVDDEQLERFEPLLTLGMHHEQQHQELLLTDLKHAFGRNPLKPAYREPSVASGGDDASTEPPPLRWIAFPEGVRWIGHGGDGFAYDNEGARHRQFVGAFRIASRPVTNGEYLRFVEAGGYDRPEFWLSDGWAARRAHDWTSPHDWIRRGDRWHAFTLDGLVPLHPPEPVCHVSYYEADAFARWAGARLPTEAEWETAADVAVEGNFLESGRLRPARAPATGANEPVQLFGDVWEWTASPYVPYPGFRPAAGAAGEYNGKFMSNQVVMRGGSCLTPRMHIRPTYRNFFYPDARWQFSGIRLAHGP